MKIAFEANVLTSPYTGIAKSLINLIKHIKDTEIILCKNNHKKIKLDLGFKYILPITFGQMRESWNTGRMVQITKPQKFNY